MGREEPIPDWKRTTLYRDALPERDLSALAEEEEKDKFNPHYRAGG